MISTQVKPILRLRASLAVGYHRLGQPMPFVYVHLVRILTTCYLPVFAFVLARLGSRNPAVHTLACVAICITCFFFLGINTVSVKLADPYGHDIDDLRIIAHCSAMPGACRALLTTGMDGRDHAGPLAGGADIALRRPSGLLLLVPLRGGRHGQPDPAPGACPRRRAEQGGLRCQCFPTSCLPVCFAMRSSEVLALALDFSPPSRHGHTRIHRRLSGFPRV